MPLTNHINVKPDEIYLARRVLENGGGVPMWMWNDLTAREYAMLQKWADKGWWDFGVSLRAGWVTDEGVPVLRERAGVAPGEGLEPP